MSKIKNEGFIQLREKCLSFAREQVGDFCKSFNQERANEMLPTPNESKGAEKNSLDKNFVISLGKLEHLPTLK